MTVIANDYIYVHVGKRAPIMTAVSLAIDRCSLSFNVSIHPLALVPSSTLTMLASSNLGFVCTVVICLEVVPCCPEHDVLAYVLKGNCATTTLENTPGDVKD